MSLAFPDVATHLMVHRMASDQRLLRAQQTNMTYGTVGGNPHDITRYSEDELLVSTGPDASSQSVKRILPILFVSWLANFISALGSQLQKIYVLFTCHS
jgi:hypothetical protein